MKQRKTETPLKLQGDLNDLLRVALKTPPKKKAKTVKKQAPKKKKKS